MVCCTKCWQMICRMPHDLNLPCHTVATTQRQCRIYLCSAWTYSMWVDQKMWGSLWKFEHFHATFEYRAQKHTNLPNYCKLFDQLECCVYAWIEHKWTSHCLWALHIAVAQLWCCVELLILCYHNSLLHLH